MTALVLNDGQRKALDEIIADKRFGHIHLLTGNAGSGKTTLMEELVRWCQRNRLEVVVTATTHKAVAVLAKRFLAAGIIVNCRTIFSLLELKPEVVSDRQVFTRSKKASPVLARVVIVDEVSMMGADLLRHVKAHLPLSYVLFVGDPAQLPPVGEEESGAFKVQNRSHLDTIVRQAEGNPLLGAARIMREQQGKPLDMSWAKSRNVGKVGVFRPSDPKAWIKRAFTSDAFNEDPDSFRYLAWTNDRVAQVNAAIRGWRYGPTNLPLVQGERALIRAPIIRDETILFNTNEETDVLGIEESEFYYPIPDCGNADGTTCAGWNAVVPSWEVTLYHEESGEDVEVHMPRDILEFNRVIDTIKAEAMAGARARWKHLFDFKGAMANLQSIYAMTVHTSQGSTFDNAFMDVADIQRRVSSNLLEAQQLFYTAGTRPRHGLFLV